MSHELWLISFFILLIGTVQLYIAYSLSTCQTVCFPDQIVVVQKTNSSAFTSVTLRESLEKLIRNKLQHYYTTQANKFELLQCCYDMHCCVSKEHSECAVTASTTTTRDVTEPAKIRCGFCRSILYATGGQNQN